MRTARVERKTKESHVLVELNLDGQGIIDVATGVPFFDHMMSQLGKHSGFNLTVKTTGDVDVATAFDGSALAPTMVCALDPAKPLA